MKKLIAKILAIVLSAVTVLGILVDNFTNSVFDLTGATLDPKFYNFESWFNYVTDLTENLDIQLAIIANYLVLGACVIAILIAILALLQVFIRNRTLNNIVKVISVIGIVVGVGSLVTLLLGCNEIAELWNADPILTLVGTVKWNLGYGALMSTVGVTLGSVFAIMGSKNGRVKKAKKRRK